MAGKIYEPVSDHAVLKKGEIKCYRKNGILNSIILKGGTLLITVKATIKNLLLHKGIILVTKTEKATLPSLHLDGNITIIDYGTVINTGDVILRKKNNHI